MASNDITLSLTPVDSTFAEATVLYNLMAKASGSTGFTIAATDIIQFTLMDDTTEVGIYSRTHAGDSITVAGSTGAAVSVGTIYLPNAPTASYTATDGKYYKVAA